MDGLKYQHFDEMNTKVNGPMARDIIKFFFGNPPIPYPATDNDCEFAQSILLAAVSASYLLSPFQKLMQSVVKFNVGTKAAQEFLKGTIIACAKTWYLNENVPVEAMEKAEIYSCVRDTIVGRFQSNHQMRLADGTPYKW